MSDKLQIADLKRQNKLLLEAVNVLRARWIDGVPVSHGAAIKEANRLIREAAEGFPETPE